MSAARTDGPGQGQSPLARLRRQGRTGREAPEWDRILTPETRASGSVPFSPGQRQALRSGVRASSSHHLLLLEGELDEAALLGSLNDLAQRHETLRAQFGDSEDSGWSIAAPAPIPVHSVDLRHLGDSDLEHQCASAIAEARSHVSEAPLSGLLARLLEDRHVLVVATHPLASDNRSTRVIARDIAEFYAARTKRRPAELPRLDVAYADHSAQSAARTAARARDLEYWRDVFAEAPVALELPTDRPRPAVTSHSCAAVTHVLSPTLREGLRELADANDATIAEVVLAGLSVLLRRYSGQRKFTVGVVPQTQSQPELLSLVGVFAGPLPLPTDLTRSASFAGLVRTTARRVREVSRHSAVTLHEVIAELRWPQDPSRNSGYQVFYDHTDLAGLTGGSSDPFVKAWPAAPTEMQADLSLHSMDDGSDLRLELLYAAALFDRETAERMLRHLVRLLTDGVMRPGLPTDRLRLLSDEEFRQHTTGWNSTAENLASAVCLHELFEHQVLATPDAIAVVAGDRRVTYRELNEQANQLAWHLRTLGVRPETFVGLCVDHSVEMFVGMFGILKAGGAYVPLDPDHPAERLAYVLGDTGAPVILTQSHLQGLLPASATKVFRLDTDWHLVADLPRHNPEVPVDSKNLVYAMFTSGSSGRPKGVLISHRSLNNYLLWAVSGYGLEGTHGAVMVGSIAFDLSVPNFFLPLIAGKDVTLLPKDHNLEALAELLRSATTDLSLLKITPAHLDVLRTHMRDHTRLDSVRTYVVGADEVKASTVAEWRRIAPGARIINEYGPTETVVGCSVHTVAPGHEISRAVPIGRPIANMSMYILDQHLEPVPVGVTGELYIGGEGVARGYLGRPDLTAEKFLPDPFSGQDGARFYRTGDLARFLPDGSLDFLGRIDHQVKIRGYRIELGEIEARLLTHPAVAEAVVAVREERLGDKYLAAYLVPAAGYRPTRTELRDFLAKDLPAYLLPRTCLFLDSLPLSPGGKVDRRLLPAP